MNIRYSIESRCGNYLYETLDKENIKIIREQYPELFKYQRYQRAIKNTDTPIDTILLTEQGKLLQDEEQ